MKTMQSFDYSPSSKKQPKIRYPMKKIKSHKKKISSQDIYSSIMLLYLGYCKSCCNKH